MMQACLRRPFRAAACLMVLIICAMAVGIARTPDYEQERMEAEARYQQALARNDALRWELSQVASESWQQSAARSIYGFAMPGEVLYQAHFTDYAGTPVTP